MGKVFDDRVLRNTFMYRNMKMDNLKKSNINYTNKWIKFLKCELKYYQIEKFMTTFKLKVS